jgi:general secretion pathway protein H
MNRDSSTAGFTLVEILVVITILSIMSALAAPVLKRPPSQTRLKADAARMAAAIRVTRAAAMAQNRPMDFVIDLKRPSYGSPVVPLSPMDPATIVATKSREIRFFPSGQSTGSDIRLRLEQAEARLQVIWATGHVVLDE